MTALTKKPIVDRNGVATSRWVKPDSAEGNVARVAGVPSKKNIVTVPELAGSPVPEVSFDKLYHVGELDAAKKKGWSLEGSGLSVSRHPMSWMRIARLQGEIHEFDVTENRFLDYHSLSDEQKTALVEWGVGKGYLKPATLYRVSQWDDEADAETYMVFDDEDEAISETDEEGFDPEPFDGYVATDSYPDKIASSIDYEQVLAAIWVNESAPELDGVWWEDTLDVSSYSAPRGVLAMAKIPEWVESARVIDESLVVEFDNDDEYYDED